MYNIVQIPSFIVKYSVIYLLLCVWSDVVML